MKVEQFKARSGNVLVEIKFKTSGTIIVPNPENTKVLYRKVISKGSQTGEDYKVGDVVVLHERPLMIIKMDFEDTPKDTMYVCVNDNDILGTVEPLSSVILN